MLSAYVLAGCVCVCVQISDLGLACCMLKEGAMLRWGGTDMYMSPEMYL
jgi:hypothetical protein